MDVTAGWYPDPDDPTNLRWWDGAVWTDHRQPLDPATATGAVPTTTSSDEQNAVTEMTAVPPPPATPDTSPFVPLSPAPGPAAAGAGSKKKPLIIVGVIAVLALIAGGAFLFLGGDSAEYTWEGENITDLDVTLEEADEIFLDGVADRNGSVTDDSRCYVVQSADDEADRPSDVLDFLRCGPVLFVDNDPDDGVWITYALVADDDVALTVADQPQSSQPSRYDSDDETMSRPDGESPPEGDGGVEPPDPPAAEPGTFLAQDPALDDLELESSYLRAVGLTKSVTLAGVGEPSR